MVYSFSDEFLSQLISITHRLTEIRGILEKQRDRIDRVYSFMEKAGSVHLYGKGRSGSIAVSLALRLKHFGYNVWFMGDVIKEPIDRNDVLILFSGSGETADVVTVARRGRNAGAKVVSVTSHEKSTLAAESELLIIIPGGIEKGRGWDYLVAQLKAKPTFLYGGGEFELFAFLFQESLVNAIGKYKKIPPSTVLKKHERD